MKQTTVFFDFEAWWESPQRGRFDIKKIIKGVTIVLDKYNVQAVFNTCGAVAEEFPELITLLYNGGHEIASHGYRHENFSQLSQDELHGILGKTEGIIFKLTKEKPIGVRSPGLLHNSIVYDVVRSRKYRWVSNHYNLFPEMFGRPDAPGSIFNTHFVARKITKINNLLFAKKRPYHVNGLLEIPLLSSLETDLLNILPAHQNSSEAWLKSAFENLKKQYNQSREYFNLNFHPWFIGSSNRITLLKNILGYLSSKKENKFVLARELLT